MWFKLYEQLEKHVKKIKLTPKTVQALLIPVWNIPNFLVKKYFAIEQYILGFIYSFVPDSVKIGFAKTLSIYQSYSIWNWLPSGAQASLTEWNDNLSPDAKAFLVHVAKAKPNDIELLSGAIRPSIIKVLMGPLEGAIGDSPTLFSGIMDFTRIFTIQDFIDKGIKIGGRGMNYDNLYLESAKINFWIKLVMIGGKACVSGLGKNELTNTATLANYLGEVPSKCFTVTSEKRFEITGKQEMPTIDFLEQNGKAFWLLEAIVGGVSRMYVATKAGEMAAATGINQFGRNLGNDLELIPIRFVSGNETIAFTNNDHIGSKYTKCVDASGGGIIAYAKCAVLSTAIVFPVDVISRFIPYVITGLPLMTLTRTTAFIFEKYIRFINGDQTAVLGIYEQIWGVAVTLAATTTVVAYGYDYFYPENKKEAQQEEGICTLDEMPGESGFVLEEIDDEL